MADSIRKEDWERFHAMGRVPPRIRDIVLGSWIRSQRDSRIETLTCAPSVAQQELGAIRDRNARLRTAAQAAIRCAGQQLNDGDAMVLLCDRRGVVMDAAGDARMLSRGAENHLHPGGAWDEAAIGTNAIGTAIHLRRPTQISSVEHYCEEIHRWNCAATPITDPADGRLLGVVDISWPNDVEQMNAAALSATLALQIESDLGRHYAMERARLVERLHMQRPRLGSDPVLVLDRAGRELAGSAGLPACLAARLDHGNLGRKSGQGFYPWKDGKPVKGRAGKAPADLATRLLTPLADAAQACIQAGVVADNDLADAGLIFGAGYAPHTGGPLHARKTQDTPPARQTAD